MAEGSRQGQGMDTAGPDMFGIMAGFECATQLRRDGSRHDFIAATRHDALARLDYALLADRGIATARDGLRWHLIEQEPGRFDWSSMESQLEADGETGVTVIWDLFHYGWPAWTSPLELEFVQRFAEFAAAAARRLGPGGHYTPVNEISFLSWGGGEAGFLPPFRNDCARELKAIYCDAAIAAAQAIRAVDPGAVLFTSEPLIHVVPALGDREGAGTAALLRLSQHDAALTLLGMLEPQRGGSPALFDYVGLNYYPHNQFDSLRRTLAPEDPRRKPLARLLRDAQRLYRKPLIISETGAEGDLRAPWLAQVAGEVRAANAHGADVRGICLYPILNHLGWDDDRYCAHGLFCGVDGGRAVDPQLEAQIAIELRRGLVENRLVAA